MGSICTWFWIVWFVLLMMEFFSGSCGLFAHIPHHDDVIKWKPFCVTGRLWRESTGDAELWCVSLICTWTNGWANKRRWYATPSRSLWRHCNDGCSTGTETNVCGCPKPVKWLWNLWVNWPAPNHNKTQQGATIWMSLGTLYMHCRKWVWNGRPTYCVRMLSHILFTWLRFLGVGWDFSSIT